MASSSFRDSIGSLGWSRRQDEPISTAPETGFLASVRNLNPFQDRSYVRLPTSESGPGAPLPAPSRREEEEGWFVRKCHILYTRIPISANISVPLATIPLAQSSLQDEAVRCSRSGHLAAEQAQRIPPIQCLAFYHVPRPGQES